jgi:hypothetical protein
MHHFKVGKFKIKNKTLFNKIKKGKQDGGK